MGLGEDDCLLLQRVGCGDDRAIALLYDRYASVVYSMALRILRDPALAEQILSEIFLEIWRTPKPVIAVTGGLSAAMAMTARSRAVAKLLHKPSYALVFPIPEGSGRLQQREMTHEDACAAVARLPADRRILLEAALFHGEARSEVAASSRGERETDEPLAMDDAASQLANMGLEVVDLLSDPGFAGRHLHVRDVAAHVEGMNRLARVFAEGQTTILQELVMVAVELCGADSAGISIEQKDATDDNFWHWIATAGKYSGFADARLPRYPSACGLALERGRPQIFRVNQRFFDLMGVQAPVVTDGILLPWQVDETRGTIWIMAHGRTEAFDREDCKLMETLAGFAATGMRVQRQQRLLVEQARASAAEAMANNLAHQINNPLQGLMQTVFLLSRGGVESGVFAQQAMGDLARLSDLVKRLLAIHRQA